MTHLPNYWNKQHTNSG